MASFLGLPLALRERVYECVYPGVSPLEYLEHSLTVTLHITSYLLPWDRTLTHGPHKPDLDQIVAEQNLHAARAACPQINAELTSHAKRSCGRRIVVSPTSSLPSKTIAYDRLRSLEIYIDYYGPRPFEWYDEGERYVVRDDLERLQSKLTKVAGMLSRFASLECLYVQFRDPGSTYGNADTFWSREYDHARPDDPDEQSFFDQNHFLLERDERRSLYPLVADLLFCLQDLPKCRRAWIAPLRGVTGFDLDGREWMEDVTSGRLEAPYFDYQYMEHLFATVEGWLMGDGDRRDYLAFEAMKIDCLGWVD